MPALLEKGLKSLIKHFMYCFIPLLLIKIAIYLRKIIHYLWQTVLQSQMLVRPQLSQLVSHWGPVQTGL